MKAFTYTGLPSRVLFGAGTLAQLEGELERLGVQRALVLSGPRQADAARALAARLGARAAGTYDRAVMHVPVAVAEEARGVARALGADGCVCLGGGSTVGLGKAIALTSGLPLLAVPTTYAGSEMTAVYGLTEGGLKRTARDLRVLPKTVIYDPELTLDMPPRLSAASGMNAIAHSVEALYAHDGNPVVSLMAEESIRALAAALPVLVAEPGNREARGEALYGAWLAGVALGSAGMALHHKLCHTLGGTFNLPHAETHAVVLPHALAYNAPAVPQALARIARALGAPDAAGGLWDLESRLGLPMTLAELGMDEAGIERAARIASETPYPNPRPVSFEGVHALLRAALAGSRPAAA